MKFSHILVDWKVGVPKDVLTNIICKDAYKRAKTFNENYFFNRDSEEKKNNDYVLSSFSKNILLSNSEKSYLLKVLEHNGYSLFQIKGITPYSGFHYNNHIIKEGMLKIKVSINEEQNQLIIDRHDETVISMNRILYIWGYDINKIKVSFHILEGIQYNKQFNSFVRDDLPIYNKGEKVLIPFNSLGYKVKNFLKCSNMLVSEDVAYCTRYQKTKLVLPQCICMEWNNICIIKDCKSNIGFRIQSSLT